MFIARNGGKLNASVNARSRGGAMPPQAGQHRCGATGEQAAATLFLASDDASYVAGGDLG